MHSSYRSVLGAHEELRHASQSCMANGDCASKPISLEVETLLRRGGPMNCGWRHRGIPQERVLRADEVIELDP